MPDQAGPAPGCALVIGDDTRSFLATVRSLGRRGIAVHAAPSDFRSPALLSRYIAAIHDLPPWMGDGGAWLDAMTALLRTRHFDLVVPCDERALLPLQRHRAALSALAPLAIPDDAAIAVLFDKHATRELARELGIPVARGRLARPGDDPAAILRELGTPVVAKPRRSFTLGALGTRGRVRIAGTAPALAAALAHAPPEEVLLEACFPGRGIGLSILASGGRVLQAFEHHRVHERAGSSFYRVSAPPNPALLACCTLMADALGFTGIAMFEFKRNPAGGFVLLEVNARPWGSMPLPLALGVDFPHRWYRLLVERVETPAVSYRAGVHGRNLVPDLMTIMADAQARHRSRLGTSVSVAAHLLFATRVLGRREVHDVWVSDDPAPGKVELQRLAQQALRRVRSRLPGAAARIRAEAEAKVRGAARDGAPVRVMFVCQGNICRSPFAAALLRQRIPDPAAVGIGSAGMIPRPGRPSTQTGIEAAALAGVDLRDHRSVWLDRAAAEGAGLIVVFDEVNAAAVADRYPALRVPLVKLGELAGLGDIADPIDGGPAVYAATYRQIAQGVDALARLLPAPLASPGTWASMPTP